MIDYTLWCEIHRLAGTGLSAPRIAAALSLDPKTVRRRLAETSYPQRKATIRKSKLDPFKARIVRLLERHPYTNEQILREIRAQGYTGGRSILGDYIRRVRPPRRKRAYETLAFAPGECAQVDWGHAGSVRVGNTRRRLSFFVMTLGHSRMMYVEFTLSQRMEYFLGCHANALEFFGGTPRKVMVDNLRSAVLSHPRGGVPEYHPRHLDLAAHYGFEPRACNVRAPHEKGQVERAVAYVRDSFLNGLEPESFAPINPQARLWLDGVANLREHRELKQRPVDRFEDERKALLPLPAAPYDAGIDSTVTASSQFRIVVDTNRYSVPAEYASRRLHLRRYPDRLRVHHDHQLIAEHPRSHERRRDILIEDHQRALLAQRRNAREQRALARLLRLTPAAEPFVQGLQERRFRAKHHILKLAALVDIHGPDPVRRAVEDALELEAYSVEYILNLLEQRARPLPEAGPLHLTRNEDLLELELPEPDLSVYEQHPRTEESDTP